MKEDFRFLKFENWLKMQKQTRLNTLQNILKLLFSLSHLNIQCILKKPRAKYSKQNRPEAIKCSRDEHS